MKTKIVNLLDLLIYWSLVLFPFSIAIAPAFTYTFMGFLFFSYFFKKLLKKERFYARTSIDMPFLALVVVSLVSIVNSIDYTASIRGIFKLVQYAFIYLIFVEEVKDRIHIKRIILAIFLGAALSSFDALWQIVFGRDFIRGHLPIINIGLKRATAAFPNANVFGVYLSAITPLIIGLSLYYYKGRKKIIMLFFSVLAIAGVALTFSRGAALGLYISALFLSILKKNKLILTSLLLLLLISPFIMPKEVKDWAHQVNYNPIIFMCNADRISIYKNTLNMIKHHPLLGVGVNTFSGNYLKYKLPEPDNARTADSMYAHNNFLQMAGEIGLLGLSMFLWLLFKLFQKCIQNYNSLKDNYLKVISLSLLACIIAFLINGLTETSLYYSRVAMIFWYLVGFSLALNKFINADRQ